MTWAAVRDAYLGQPPIEALYQPIEHPDFAGWPVVRACRDRMDLMVDALESRGVFSGTLLDLGCHTGWFCRAFASYGWQTVGIDRSAPWLNVAEAMNGYVAGADVLPRYVLADIETLDPLPYADVALCLSCAMYFSWDGPVGWNLLGRISEAAPILFLDLGGMYAERVPFGESDMVEAIVARTRYTRGQVLGHTGEDRRPLVVFTR